MNKPVNIAINGMGRVGRLAFRIALENENINVIAVNDLMPAEQMAYLVKYDSVHGRFKGEIAYEDNHLVANGKKIKVTAEPNPENLPWKDLDVDVVFECTGVFKNLEPASAYLKTGAKKVIISAPSKDAPTFVMGVNHENIKPEDHIISNASCTTNCLAVLAKVVHDNFGIAEGLVSTVHAVTVSQFTVDSPSKKNYRIGRAAYSNIIPSTTGAAKAVIQVIPELEGKITAMALRVPTADVSVVDLTFRTEKDTSLKSINEAIKKAAESDDFKGLLAYTEDEVVSQDFVSDEHSCIYDAGASVELNSRFFKLIAWYDNEYGYAARMVDLALYINTLN